jgi:hypothetical protein
MDTMKLLLGATVALLLGALAVSWQGMQTGVRNTPADEVARLEKQIKELRAEQDKLALEKQMQQLQGQAAIATPTSNAAEIEAMKAQMEAGKAAIQKLEAEKAERDRVVADQEELELDKRDLESKDVELRRARMISEALLIGKVADYIKDDLGGFVTFSILMPEQVQVGTILAIRRKTGILGQLKVSDVTPDGGIANPIGDFSAASPQFGDELILPPQY